MAALSTTSTLQRKHGNSSQIIEIDHYEKCILEIQQLVKPFTSEDLPLIGQDVRHCERILKLMKYHCRSDVMEDVGESNCGRVVFEGTKALKAIVEHGQRVGNGFGGVSALKCIMSYVRSTAQSSPDCPFYAQVRGQLKKGGLDGMLRDLCKSELKGLKPEELKVLRDDIFEIVSWTSAKDRLDQKLDTMLSLTKVRHANAKSMNQTIAMTSETPALDDEKEPEQEAPECTWTPAPPEMDESAPETEETVIKMLSDGKGGFVPTKVTYKPLPEADAYEYQPHAGFAPTRTRRAQGAVQPQKKGVVTTVKALLSKK